MYLLPIFLPFVTSLFITFTSSKLGSFGAVLLSLISIIITLTISIFVFIDGILCNSTCWIKISDWMQVSVFQTNWGFLFDSIVVTRLIVITTISTLVHRYAVGYMGFDPHLPRFRVYLSLFTGFMILLVTADNYLQLFLGWEGVGVTSFLLINFWYTRIQAVKSAIKAIIFNRIGDFFLLIGILNVFFLYGTLDFQTVFNYYDEFAYVSGLYRETYSEFAFCSEEHLYPYFSYESWLNVIINDYGIPIKRTFTSRIVFVYQSAFEYADGITTDILYLKAISKYYLKWLSTSAFNYTALLLFLGAVGKSAQLGLNIWLVDAREGPTPVSALIHAATMVTAGVFLLIRSSPILEISEVTLVIIAYVGALTAFFGSFTAFVQNDIKRIIAYSTCSQLGFMVAACGLSQYVLALFHLVNHAFFKAALFLGSGSVIHAMQNEQDIRRMGLLARQLPLTYTVMLIAALANMGFPFLTGFYSKDVIIEVGWLSMEIYDEYSFLFLLLISSTFFTSFYTFRLLYLVFLGKTYNGYISKAPTGDSSFLMSFPLIVLVFPTIFAGFYLKDFFLGYVTDFFYYSITKADVIRMYFLNSHVVGTSPANMLQNIFYFNLLSERLILLEFLVPFGIKLLPLVMMFSSFVCYATFMNVKGSLIYTPKFSGIIWLYNFLNKRWYIDMLYNKAIGYPILNLSKKIMINTIDRGFIEFFRTIYNFIFAKINSLSFDLTNNGTLQSYVLTALITTILTYAIMTIFSFDIVDVISEDMNLLIVNIILALVLSIKKITAK